MRTYQHIIDTKAVRQVLSIVPEHCVVRGLTERDYGIDLMIEMFSKAGVNKHGHEFYDSTGHICYLQLKGTDKELVPNSKGNIGCSIEKKFLFYAEKLSTPCILMRVCTQAGKEKIYFIWIQRYISDILDIVDRNWRIDSEESLTVYIPAQNILPDNFEKIERISWRIKYLEELAEFHETYTDLTSAFKALINFKDKYEFFSDIIAALTRLSNLSTLLKQNNCCIDRQSILDLIDYIKEVKNGTKTPNKLEDFPDNFNLELLRTSTASTRFVEELEAENEGRTIY